MSIAALNWLLRGCVIERRRPDGTVERRRGAVPLPKVSRRVTPAMERSVLFVLCDHAGDVDGEWQTYPSQQTIADESGMGRRSVRECLASLEGRGLIVKVAPAVPRVQGETYRIARDSGHQTRPSSVGDELGSPDPPESASTRAGSRAGSRAGTGAHKPEPEPYVPLPRDETLGARPSSLDEETSNDDDDARRNGDEPVRLDPQRVAALLAVNADAGRAELDAERRAADAERKRRAAGRGTQ